MSSWIIRGSGVIPVGKIYEELARGVPFQLGENSTVQGQQRGKMHKSLMKSEANNVMEILDRVLDHGIVFDPSTRLQLLRLDLHKTHEQVVIDWRNTYF